MKKVLLSAMALVASMSMNAQVFQVNGSGHGLTGDLSDVAEGHVWGTVDGVATISNAFATQHKTANCKNNDYVQVTIDGTVISTSDGVQGNDNPKDIDGANPATSLKQPASGAVIQIDAKKDGYAYVIGKLSSNKNYVVFEEGTAVGYDLWMEIADDRFPNKVIAITVEGEGEYNEVKEPIAWPVCIALNDAEAATAGNGLGVIGFPIYEGCKYYAHAAGSKISWSGIFFTDAPAQTISVEKEDGTSLVLYSADPAGIQKVQAAAQNSAIYNVAGQKVDENYKGLVIKNGKKVIQ